MGIWYPAAMRPPKSIIYATYALFLCSCVGPFASKPTPTGPSALEAEFDSGSASARLTWPRSRLKGFSRYQIERSKGTKFVPVATITERKDTTFVDEGLLANRAYQYRVVIFFTSGGEGEESLVSEVIDGGIHRFVDTWSLPDGFLPTRLAVDQGGTVYVVGAATSVVERYDRKGTPLGGWQFASGQSACLETGTLDGPGVALDSEGSLYVAYNLMRSGRSPRARWSKFDARGRHEWTKDLGGIFARHIAIFRDQVYIEAISHLQQFDIHGRAVAEHRVPPLLVSSLRLWSGDFAALVEPLNVAEVGWKSPRLVVYRGAARTDMGRILGRDPLSEDDRGAGLLHRPSDFAVHEPSNRVFVVNAGYGRIEVFKDNSYLTRWGQAADHERAFAFTGRATVIEDMTLGTTHHREVVAGGIALDRQGYVYVADTFNNRIQKFRP